MGSFYPAVSGRATSQLGISRLLFQINNDQLAIQDLQKQLSTGRRIERPSENPASAIRALTAQRQLEFRSQIDENLQSADTLLGATETSLAQAQGVLNEVRGIVVQASSSTLSKEERDAFVAQVQAGVDKLTEIANTKFRDQFIFGGSSITDSPVSAVGKNIRFSGNDSELQTFSDFSSTIAANVTADEAFGVRSSKVVGTVDLDPGLTLDTPLSLLNRGEGVSGGAISFSDGVSPIVELDLANAYDLNDVVEAINGVTIMVDNGTSITPRQLSASLSGTGLDVQFQDGLGGVLRIAEVGSGVTAQGLGIVTDSSNENSPILGSDLNPLLTLETRLADLFAGAGLAPGSFQITQGEESFFVSTGGLETVEDLINRIHQTGAAVEANIDSSGRFLSIRSLESGTALSIGENGDDLATRLGIRTLDLDTSLDSLNFGQGLYSTGATDYLVLHRTDGSSFSVDLTGTQNVGDVINRINANTNNFNPAFRITASLAANGNGLQLSAPVGTEQIRVSSSGGSQAAWGLGLAPIGTNSSAGQTVGTESVITGADVSGIEVEGAFTTLIRVQDAIDGDQPEALLRLADALDEDIQRLSLTRGFVGARQQSIALTEDLSTEQQLQLTQIESDELDADLARVISDLAAREAALQASLQLMGRVNQLSLFNFL